MGHLYHFDELTNSATPSVPEFETGSQDTDHLSSIRSKLIQLIPKLSGTERVYSWTEAERPGVFLYLITKHPFSLFSLGTKTTTHRGGRDSSTGEWNLGDTATQYHINVNVREPSGFTENYQHLGSIPLDKDTYTQLETGGSSLTTEEVFKTLLEKVEDEVTKHTLEEVAAEVENYRRESRELLAESIQKLINRILAYDDRLRKLGIDSILDGSSRSVTGPKPLEEQVQSLFISTLSRIAKCLISSELSDTREVIRDFLQFGFNSKTELQDAEESASKLHALNTLLIEGTDELLELELTREEGIDARFDSFESMLSDYEKIVAEGGAINKTFNVDKSYKWGTVLLSEEGIPIIPDKVSADGKSLYYDKVLPGALNFHLDFSIPKGKNPRYLAHFIIKPLGKQATEAQLESLLDIIISHPTNLGFSDETHQNNFLSMVQYLKGNLNSVIQEKQGSFEIYLEKEFPANADSETTITQRELRGE